MYLFRGRLIYCRKKIFVKFSTEKNYLPASMKAKLKNICIFRNCVTFKKAVKISKGFKNLKASLTIENFSYCMLPKTINSCICVFLKSVLHYLHFNFRFMFHQSDFVTEFEKQLRLYKCIDFNFLENL